MNRRNVLTAACAGTASLLGATASVPVGSAHELDPPVVSWRRTYDFPIAAATSAHGEGHVFVGRGGEAPDAEVPVRVAAVDESGEVRERREIEPEIPEDARRASADVVRTEDGYAVASGAWFAELGTDLSVETTGFADGYAPNGTTYLTDLPDGFVVAAERDAPNHVSTVVFGFDKDGALRWTREYGEDDSRWLGFLLDGPDGGVVVGGRSGGPWLASLAADGTERWRETVTDTLPGVGHDAVTELGGVVLFGGSNLIRLDEDRSVEWERPYDGPNSSGGEMVMTPDGDYVTAVAAGTDGVLVSGIQWQGPPVWDHEYAAVESGAAELSELVGIESGGYLLVGSNPETGDGWALRLSGARTMTQTTDAGSAGTDTTSKKALDGGGKTPASEDTPETGGSVPGFGIGGALVGLAAGLLARRRR